MFRYEYKYVIGCDVLAKDGLESQTILTVDGKEPETLAAQGEDPINAAENNIQNRARGKWTRGRRPNSGEHVNETDLMGANRTGHT